MFARRGCSHVGCCSEEARAGARPRRPTAPTPTPVRHARADPGADARCRAPVRRDAPGDVARAQQEGLSEGRFFDYDKCGPPRRRARRPRRERRVAEEARPTVKVHDRGPLRRARHRASTTSRSATSAPTPPRSTSSRSASTRAASRRSPTARSVPSRRGTTRRRGRRTAAPISSSPRSDRASQAPTPRSARLRGGAPRGRGSRCVLRASDIDALHRHIGDVEKQVERVAQAVELKEEVEKLNQNVAKQVSTLLRSNADLGTRSTS